jgi:hypothetical protein
MLGLWAPAGGGASAWTDLTDTPASITALQFVRGNAGGTALEFIDLSTLATLQFAYDNSTSPEIVVDGTNGAVTIRDNATPIAAELFEVEDNAGANLFDVAVDRMNFNSPLEIGDVSANDQVAIRYRPTFSPAAYIGGMISAAADITYTNALFIVATLADNSRYRAGVGPGFAAFTLFNALPIIQNSGNFNLVQALVLNCGVVHARITSGTSIATQTVGLSFSPQTRASVSGAVMTKSIGDSAVTVNPTYSTVVGSTVNFGTIIGINCRTPAVALFQTGTGTETMTGYIGLNYSSMNFGGNVTKIVVNSALPAATLSFFLNNAGGAQSDFGGGFIVDVGLLQILSDTLGLSLGAAGGDVQILWDGTDLKFDPLVGDNLRMNFSTVSSRDTYIWTAQDFGVSQTNYTELALGFDRCTFGEVGAIGNNIFKISAPDRLVAVGGGWADVLLTQAGNLDIDTLTMSDVAAWAVNAISLATATGSISDIATFRIGGMTTSFNTITGTRDTAALYHTGRRTARGVDAFEPLSPSALTVSVNDYAPATGNSMRQVWRLTTDDLGGVNITGIATQQGSDTQKIVNIGTVDAITLTHQDAASAAGNRFLFSTAANIVLGANGGSISIWHDATTDRWRDVN